MEYLSQFEKARKELEDFYLGAPDDSLNLSFDYLAQAQQQKAGPSPDEKKSGPSDPTMETNPRKQEQSTHFRHHSSSGSLRNHHANGNNGRHAARGPHRYPRRQDGHGSAQTFNSERTNYSVSLGHSRVVPQNSSSTQIVLVPKQTIWASPHYVAKKRSGPPGALNNSRMARAGSASLYPLRGEEGRRRPWIPHSNRCSICCNYIFVFHSRCLVCGRTYCRRCVCIGMGEMTEGRKCVECLGGKTSRRYVPRACCTVDVHVPTQGDVVIKSSSGLKRGSRTTSRDGIVKVLRCPDDEAR